MLETNHDNDVLKVGMKECIPSSFQCTTEQRLAAEVQPSITQHMMATLRFPLHRLKTRCLGTGIQRWLRTLSASQSHGYLQLYAAIHSSYTFFHQRCHIFAKCFAVKCMWGVLLFVVRVQVEYSAIQNKHTVAVQKPDADMIWTRQAAKVLLQAGASAFARNCSGPMPQFEHIMSSGTPCELLRQTPRFPKGKNAHSNDIYIPGKPYGQFFLTIRFWPLFLTTTVFSQIRLPNPYTGYFVHMFFALNE